MQGSLFTDSWQAASHADYGARSAMKENLDARLADILDSNVNISDQCGGATMSRGGSKRK
jgi:hypothetical protein